MSQSWSFRDRVATSAPVILNWGQIIIPGPRPSDLARLWMGLPADAVRQSLTLALASLAASASAAMALWSCTGRRTSFLKER